MSTMYHFLGTGVKWLVKGKCRSFNVNKHLLTSSALNLNNCIVRSIDLWRCLSSKSHFDVDVCSAESTIQNYVDDKHILVNKNSSSSAEMTLPIVSDNNCQTILDKSKMKQDNTLSSTILEEESAMGEAFNLKLPPIKAFDEVAVEESPEVLSFIDTVGPPPPKSFNLAAYVNMSPSLQELVKLGVELHEIEEKGFGQFILNLDFERDMKNHIQFLHDVGVPPEELGRFLTVNPKIFDEDLDNLRIKINYLEIKKFSSDAIARIVTQSPLYLSLSVKFVDQRLGFYQKTFGLTGNEVRYLITKNPKLVPYKHEKLLERIFIIKEEMGFSSIEMKQLLLMKPKLYILGSKSLRDRFNVIHNVMGIPHEQIMHFPAIFFTRHFIIEQRHKYLEKHGRAQYNPSQPNYVSLQDIATLPDAEFCIKCAKTSLFKFNEFLKTL